jgi:hypothetical protein
MLTQVLLQILLGTPLWVLPLFIGLGLLSGIFLARALWVWSRRPANLVFNHA